MFLHGSKSTVRRTVVTVKKPSGVSKSSSTSKVSSGVSSHAGSARQSPSLPHRSASSLNTRQAREQPPATTGKSSSRTRPARAKAVAAPNLALFSDSEESEAELEGESENGGRSSPAGVGAAGAREQPGPGMAGHDRRDSRAWSTDRSSRCPVINAADLTADWPKTKYAPLDLGGSGGETVGVQLRYPGLLPGERFSLVYPVNDNEAYHPVDDIIHTIDAVVRYYFPPETAEIDPSSRLTTLALPIRRAVLHRNRAGLETALGRYNSLVAGAIKAADGKALPVLNSMGRSLALPLPLTERILAQVYSRTVSPKVELLKQYANGTSDVYGELLPRFISQIFRETGLKRNSVFVDLGSGVGNVVLQAALEIGCESWGIEKNDNPARLGAAHLREFKARARLWGIRPGKASLVHGDFCVSPEIDRVLSRADVVLVNNKAFLPALNDQLLMKFLDLKEGTRVVSLRSFLPKGWQIKGWKSEDPRNVLRVQPREYFSGSVSWTDSAGEYFVATKDSSRLREYARAKGESE